MHRYEYDDRKGYYNALLSQPKRIGSYYDSLQSIYAEHPNTITTFSYGKSHADNLHTRVRRFIPAKLPDSAAILDAGCGNGHFAAALADHHKDVTVHALNVSSLQLNHAKRHNARANIVYGLRTYADTGLPANSIDVAIFQESIGYAPLETTLEEMHRVLKPGGMLVIQDICQIDDLGYDDDEQLRMAQHEWHYAFYPVDYHLTAAADANFSPVLINRNANFLVHTRHWEEVMERGLSVLHNTSSINPPVKCVELVYLKSGRPPS